MGGSLATTLFTALGPQYFKSIFELDDTFPDPMLLGFLLNLFKIIEAAGAGVFIKALGQRESSIQSQEEG